MSYRLSKTRVYVANLPWRATGDTLRTHFSNFGKVVFSAVAIDNATGCSRGFGVVEFLDPQVAAKVISLNHTILHCTLVLYPGADLNSMKNDITVSHELDNDVTDSHELDNDVTDSHELDNDVTDSHELDNDNDNNGNDSNNDSILKKNN
eukprot:TRINITY_DN740_c0_g1_i1.p1 TRINITY_DN740_c0_g1~~TRINITY_DN740_c0_g1_i1.p1  ORF type:complete len:150 (-),score=62.51 TRINITY_DN740_c0_g1_i1:51-500(-)